MNRLLVLVLIFAAILRFWQLGSVPPSASMDEASIGWNAYSVLRTGGDEYGDFPLISQRGYDDWRRSTYLFFTIPFVALFDLQVIAVRLPAVILSVLTVWATYQIVLLLFSKRSERAVSVALVASMLLAISPWHVYISRLGHESNAYLSFFVLAVLFFLQGLSKSNRLFLSLIFFTLSMISYYAGQVLVPLFGLGLLAIYKKSLKKLIIPIVVFIPLFIFILWSIFSPSALVRFQGTSAFDLSQKKITNVRIFAENYVSHFNVKWLFTNSGGESFKVPNVGLLYVWELPFILIGIFAFLFHHDLDKRAKKLIFLWFLFAPLPASIATQAPHAMRSYAFLPTWQIFTAFGVAALTKKFRMLSVALLTAVFGVYVLYVNYFIVFPKEQSDSFHYALSIALPIVFSKGDDFDKIVFSNKDNLYQSYMLYLYYRRFDPYEYQRMGGTKSGGFAETHTIGKYGFRPIDWNNENRGLYIGNVSEFPEGAAGATISNLDGTPAIKIVEKSL